MHRQACGLEAVKNNINFFLGDRMKRVYLCGPINGCNDGEANDWRTWVKERLPKSTRAIDPMVRDYRGRESESYREIVELDKRDIRMCDVVVVMYTRPSVGTSMEIFYAWTLGIPVVVINESESATSPWLVYHSTSTVSRSELMAKLKQVLGKV